MLKLEIKMDEEKIQVPVQILQTVALNHGLHLYSIMVQNVFYCIVIFIFSTGHTTRYGSLSFPKL